MRILYVEDDQRDADLALRQLRRTTPDWRVEIVGSLAGAAARLNRLNTESLDLVLTDVGLPDGDGLSLLRHIRDLALPLAVVVITGTDDEETAVAALKAGADDYIVKRKNYLASLPLTLESALHHYRADIVRRSRPLRVLYAEPNHADVDMTRRHFAAHAAHIHLDATSTGPETLRRIESGSLAGEYDVILLDYRLPGLDALEVLKELRLARKIDTPVVLVTGRGDDEVAIQAIKLGAASYLVKDPGYLYKLPAELENASFRAELRRRENALRLSQDRYKLATTAGLSGVWEWDFLHGEMFVDLVLKSILGYEDHEIRNHFDDWSRHIHNEDVELVMEGARSHIAGDTPAYEVEHRMLHKDGSVRWFLARGAVMAGDDASASRIVGTNTDITERKRAAEALRQSESKTDAILKAIPDLMFLLSKDGIYLDYHAKDSSDLYASPESFLGKRVRDVMPQELGDAIESCIERTMLSSETVVMEYSLAVGGEERHFESRMARCDTDKALSVVRDITDRRRAAETLKQSEERLRLAQRAARVGTWDWNISSGKSTWSEGIYELLGLVPGDGHANVDDFIAFLHPEDRGRVLARVESVIADGETYDDEFRIIRSDGGIVWLASKGRVVRDASGAAERMIGVNIDVTDRKLAEEAKRASQARFAGIVDIADDAIVSVDAQQRITLFNKGAEKIFGSSAREMIGRPLDDLLPDSLADRHRQHIADFARSSDGSRRMGERREIFGRRKDGNVFPAEASISRLNLGGEQTYTVILRDITERKRDEEALRSSEERFRQLAENIQKVFFMSEGFSEDSAGKILYVSPSYETIWGRSCASLYADTRSWLEAVHPEDRERVEAALPGMPKGDFDEDFRIVRPDQEVRWVHDRVFPVYNESGEVYRLAGIVEDITERKQAEELLGESEQRLRLALEAGRMGVWDWNLKANSIKWSKEHYTIMGIAPFSVEPTYDTWAERVHEDDYRRICEAMEKSLREKSMYQAEYRIVWPDETVRWVEARSMPVCDQNGECVRVRGIVVDITERKEAENAVRESREQYRSVVESQTDLICRYLPDTTLTFVNSAYCRYFDKSRDQLIGTKFLDLIPESSREAARRHVESLMKNPSVEADEHEVILPGGGIGWQRWVDHVIFDSQGDPIEFQAIGHDITERKRAQESLLQRDQLLQAMFQSLSSHVVVLDREGRITYASRSWDEFTANQAPMVDVRAGNSYLEVLRRGGDDRVATQAEQGIRGVIEGELPSFRIEYPCHLATEQRWLLLCVDSMPPEHGGVVISHTDITERKLAEKALKEALDELRRLKDQLHAENVYLQEAIMVEQNFGEIIGRSERLKKVLRQAEQVAPLDTTVLILGETGTGKELLAHAIHNFSPRKNRPLVKVNCATLPSHLIESELFGHEKGAFTGAHTKRAGRFEIANGGTILLDEIGELPLDLQAKLLRVLQEGQFERLGSSHTIAVNVRIIAATNRDLEEAVRKGTFRSDLYYRLSIFPIKIPALRDRREDIPYLVMHFVKQIHTKLGKEIESIPQETMDALQNYAWPGNIRELRNVIERAAIISQGTRLRLLDSLESAPVLQEPPLVRKAAANGSLETLEESQRKLIIQALEQTYWRVEGPNGAAAMLGVHPNTLRSRCKKLGITRPKFRDRAADQSI